MNLTEQIQFSTFLFAILAALLSTIGRHYASGPHERRFMLIERSTLAGFAVIYVLYNLWCVMHALQ